MTANFFQKIVRIGRSQLLLDGRFGPKFHLAQTFFATRLSSFFPFFAVHYSFLQFVTARRMLADLRWHFVFHCPHRFLTLIQTTIRTLRCVVNNDKVCETQHPHICVVGARTEIRLYLARHSTSLHNKSILGIRLCCTTQLALV